MYHAGVCKHIGLCSRLHAGTATAGADACFGCVCCRRADQLPEEHEGTNLEVAMAQHLLAAADMYQLTRLRRICERRLCESVDVETAATTLALAEQNHAEVSQQLLPSATAISKRARLAARMCASCLACDQDSDRQQQWFDDC